MIKAPRYSKCLYFSLPLALAAVLLFCCLPCPAVYAAPALVLDISSGPVGTPVVITGTIFHSYAGDSIHIIFDTTEIETIIIPPDGSFTISWAIPADATGGLHTIGAKRETTDSSFFISAPFTVDVRQLVLDVSQGIVGTAITMSGSGFYINEAVTISYLNPTTSNIGTVTASSSGEFSRSYVIPAGAAGYHRLSASNARGNTAEAYFKILPDILSDADCGAPGELVYITGRGFGASSTITMYLGPLVMCITICDDHGNFTAEFAIPEIATASYNLKAIDSLGNTAEIVFPVTAGATLSTDTGAVGDTVTVNGDGFTPGSTITVSYDDEPLAYVTADINGGFSINITVPLSDGGDHMINISDGETTRRYTYTVETDPPAIPTLQLPSYNSVTSAYTEFEWQAVTDPSIPVTYDLEIATDQSFSGPVLQKEGLPEPKYLLAGEEAMTANSADSHYYWRVMATDGAGNRSGWSETWTFSIDAPTTPILSMPANGAVMDFPIGLSWVTATSLSGQMVYNLQVSRNSEFSELLIDEKGLTATLYTIPLDSKRIFNKKIPYYWRVKAEDSAHNTSGWSTTGSFNIVSTGFPAWATWTLISLGALIILWLIYRFTRRKTYQYPD